VPTYEVSASARRDYQQLTREQRRQWRTALEQFVGDLRAGQFHPRLRVKRVQGHDGIWEMTWGPNGRATFEYGRPIRSGEPHIIWRRIGTHDIFRQP
jgi:hypothetical protein